MSRGLLILLPVVVASAASDSPLPPAADSAQAPALTVRAALQRAWHHHPEMKRARAMIGQTYGRQIQAALWPNPSLEVSGHQEPDRKRAAQIGFSQRFELGGKRKTRISAAAAGVLQKETELLETWADIRAQVKEAFVRLAYARQRFGLQERILRADARRLELAQSLLQVGKLSEEECLRFQQERDRGGATRKAAEVLLEDARRQVVIAMGGPGLDRTKSRPKDRTAIVCSIDAIAPPADDMEGLKALAQTNNPALRAARTRTAVATALLRLARTKRWSDLKVSLAYRNTHYEETEGGTGHALIAGVSVDLPVWNRYQGDVAAARGRIVALRQAEEVTALNVASRLSDILAAQQRWIAEEATLRERILPAAEKRLDLARDAFVNGKASEIGVLARVRETEALGLEHLQTRLMLAVTAIQLERTVTAATVGAPGSFGDEES